MKNIKTLILLTAVLFIFTSCDELVKKDVDVPITFTLIEQIAVPEDSDPKAENKYGVGGSYDILSHPDVANVIGTPDKIKKIQITKIRYEFDNFKGNVDAILSGVIGLPTKNGSGYLGSYIDSYFEINPVNVAEANLLSNQYTLNGDFSKVNEYLSENVELQYAVMGVSTHNPVNFNIVLTVSATVTVEASIDFQGNYN